MLKQFVAAGLLFARIRAVIRAPWSDFLRNLPHHLLAQGVVKVVEEGDNAIVAFERVLAFVEAFHILQYVKLLPALAEVDSPVGQSVRIANVHERQVLKDQTDVRDTGRLSLR